MGKISYISLYDVVRADIVACSNQRCSDYHYFIETMAFYLDNGTNTQVPRDQYGTLGIVFAGLLGRFLDRIFGKSDQKQRFIWRFLDESLKLHKAHVLERIVI